MTATSQNLIPLPRLQFFSDNGTVLAGGFVYTFEADGTTPKETYTDPYGAVPNANPVPLDGAGRASIWGTGQFVWQVTDALGNNAQTGPTADPVDELHVSDAMLPVIQAATTSDAVALLGIQQSAAPIGGIVLYGGASPPTDWFFCAGGVASRSTNSQLFGVIGTTFGVGDGATTFGLPDLRGRAPFGTDAMGGTPASRLTLFSAVNGASGGDQNAQNPNLVLTDTGHIHAQETAQTLNLGGSDLPKQAGPNGFYGVNTATAMTGITVTSNLTGTSQNIPPALIINFIIYAGTS